MPTYFCNSCASLFYGRNEYQKDMVLQVHGGTKK